ncbi:hypothetical protein HK104_005919, partial [Borealophlyctis nickersoniae]
MAHEFDDLDDLVHVDWDRDGGDINRPPSPKSSTPAVADDDSGKDSTLAPTVPAMTDERVPEIDPREPVEDFDFAEYDVEERTAKGHDGA